MAIQYVTGDATQPIGEGNKIIAHVCNDIGAWGAGFVLAISKRWQAPETMYREWKDRKLGHIQVVSIEPGIWVANMIAQHGLRHQGNEIPLRYEALRECLLRVSGAASALVASIHMPKIGSGLAGGDWNVIEQIIVETLGSATVYEL